MYYVLLPIIIAITSFFIAFTSEGKYRSILFYCIAATALFIGAGINVLPYTTSIIVNPAYNITSSSGNIYSIGAHNQTIQNATNGNILFIYMMPEILFGIICVTLAVLQVFSIRPNSPLFNSNNQFRKQK